MAAVADEGPARLPAAPALGDLLVRRGLLSEAQLVLALEAQQRTGRRLSDLIVELGLASPASVAQALAAQHGGFTRSERPLGGRFRARGVECLDRPLAQE